MTSVCSATSRWRGCAYPAEGLCFFKMGIREDNARRIVPGFVKALRHMLQVIAVQCGYRLEGQYYINIREAIERK